MIHSSFQGLLIGLMASSIKTGTDLRKGPMHPRRFSLEGILFSVSLLVSEQLLKGIVYPLALKAHHALDHVTFFLVQLYLVLSLSGVPFHYLALWRMSKFSLNALAARCKHRKGSKERLFIKTQTHNLQMPTFFQLLDKKRQLSSF